MYFYAKRHLTLNIASIVIVVHDSSPQEKRNHHHLHRCHSECHHRQNNNDNDGHHHLWCETALHQNGRIEALSHVEHQQHRTLREHPSSANVSLQKCLKPSGV